MCSTVSADGPSTCLCPEIVRRTDGVFSRPPAQTTGSCGGNFDSTAGASAKLEIRIGGSAPACRSIHVRSESPNRSMHRGAYPALRADAARLRTLAPIRITELSFSEGRIVAYWGRTSLQPLPAGSCLTENEQSQVPYRPRLCPTSGNWIVCRVEYDVKNRDASGFRQVVRCFSSLIPDGFPAGPA